MGDFFNHQLFFIHLHLPVTFHVYFYHLNSVPLNSRFISFLYNQVYSCYRDLIKGTNLSGDLMYWGRRRSSLINGGQTDGSRSQFSFSHPFNLIVFHPFRWVSINWEESCYEINLNSQTYMYYYLSHLLNYVAKLRTWKI